MGRYLYDCALYKVSQGKGCSSENCGVHFLFDKDRFETQPHALAVYDRGMLHNFLDGGFPTASLHPHPAHKNIALLHCFRKGCANESWSLMSPHERQLPNKVAAQSLLPGISPVSYCEARGVHQPLPVLPEVVLVHRQRHFSSLTGRHQWSFSFLRCRSCNVCETCFGDKFVRSRDPRLDIPFCKCSMAKCDLCRKLMTRQHFGISRWHHRSEAGRRIREEGRGRPRAVGGAAREARPQTTTRRGASGGRGEAIN